MPGRHEPQPSMDTPNQTPDERYDADRLGIPGGLTPTIWRLPPSPLAGALTPQLARRVLDTYTAPQDVVIDVDDHSAVATAVTGAGRRHVALRGTLRLATEAGLTGTAGLVVLTWPRPDTNPRWLLTTCRTLLAPSGRLVIAVSVSARQRVPQLSALTGAARTAGLVHISHVVAIIDAPTGAAHELAAQPSELAGAATIDSESSTAETRHRDLVVFLRPPSASEPAAERP
jgi:hypothetical protein